MNFIKILLLIPCLLIIHDGLLCQENDRLAPGGAEITNKTPNNKILQKVGNSYIFTFSGDDEVIKYSINLLYPVTSGIIQIDAEIGNTSLKPLQWGGLRFRDQKGNVFEPADFRDNYRASLIKDLPDYNEKRLTLEYEDLIDDQTFTYKIEFHLEGKTLVFEIYATDETGGKYKDGEYVNGFNNYCGFSFDQEEQFQNSFSSKARIIEIPYAVEWTAIYNDQFFFSTYLDRSKSSASVIGPSDGVGEYKYPATFIGPITENFPNLTETITGLPEHENLNRNTFPIQESSDESIINQNIDELELEHEIFANRKMVPVDETGYITVSSRIMDTLPKVSNPESPYREDLRSRVILNVWDPGPFSAKDFVVARKWTAPKSGTAQIYGNAHFLYQTGGNSVMLKIIRIKENNVTEDVLWSRELLTQYNEGFDFNLDVEVQTGDSIYFSIHSLIASFFNGVYFSPIIILGNDTYDSYNDYSLESGGIWSYVEKINSDGIYIWKSLEADTRTGRWEGEDTTNTIGRTWGLTGRDKYFVLSEEYLNKLYQYGMKDIAVIHHMWQHYNYDWGLPKHCPPDSSGSFGGLERFNELVNTANKLGYLFAAHENYLISDYVYKTYLEEITGETIDDEDFDKYPCFTKRVDYDDNGKLTLVGKKQLYEKNTISSDWMKYFANKNDGCLGLKSVGVNAGFLDIITGNNPEATHQINLDPNSYVFEDLKPSDSFKNVIYNNKDLFKFMHDTYKGPLFGEGGYYWGRFDSFYAGYVDGVERQIEDNMYAPIIPDYELKNIRPIMVNHGMGYYDRYYANTGYSDINLNYDYYRSSEIAYGHAAFIDCRFNTNILFPVEHQLMKIKEYYLMQQLQYQYLETNVDVDVWYWDDVDNRFINLDSALKKSNFDFVDVRLKIEYKNGLSIYINRNRKEDWPLMIDPRIMVLPPNGWFAENKSNNFIAYTIRAVDNTIVDYVNSEEYTFAETRKRELKVIENIETNGMAIINKRAFDRRDICLLGGSKMNYTDDKGIIEVDTHTNHPCYLTLNYINDNAFKLNIDSVSDILTVTYKDISEDWKTMNNKLPSDGEGFVLSSFISIKEGTSIANLKETDVDIKTDGDTLIFERLKPLTNYIVTVKP